MNLRLLDDPQIPAPDHLYTWVDVDRHFADLAIRGFWPSWLLEVSAYWQTATFSVRGDVAESDIWNYLTECLGALTVDAANRRIFLDSAGATSDRWLTVEIARTAVVAAEREELLWASRRVVAGHLREPRIPERIASGIPILAFHSFKGGVGRTLHCVATALELAKHGKRVLLVDADLEAPGITWMWQAQSLRVDFSFEDFLALLHGSEDGQFSDALSLGTRFLANQELDGIVVMPARRRASRAEPSLIEPAHLMTPSRSPTVITDALAELAKNLEADAILIDLRAGVSELSAPLLLDPRLRRVIVSTISDQSVRGSSLILQELSRRAPARTEQGDPDVLVLLTQFNERLHSDRLAEVADLLRQDAISASGVLPSHAEDEPEAGESLADQDSREYVIPSSFNSQLLSLPATWSEVASVIQDAGICDAVSPIAETIVAAHDSLPGAESEPEPRSEPAEFDRVRSQVALTAQTLTYAEQTFEESNFLVTEALANLAEAHQTDVPIEVVIGAKGSGKTFTFLQVCSRQYWSDFVEYVGGPSPMTSSESTSLAQVPTVPVIQSGNLSQDLVDHLSGRRENIANSLGRDRVANPLELRDLINEQLSNDTDDVTWRRTWLACFARSVGIDASIENAQAALTEFARTSRALFVIDGLEDLFQDFTANPRQQRALRVLLTDCAEWMRTLRGRPLGLLTFIRKDLAQQAIPQNFAQFESHYANYALRWNRDEALRLAAWVCRRGGALQDHSEADIREADAGRLSQWMNAVWGDKMGGPRSKEARSEPWFFAALSDFSAQIQARDIVSFLGVAAGNSVGDTRYPTRLLAPSAMRSALPECSRQKIAAIEQENPPVGQLLAKLRELPEADRKVPFTLDAVKLDLKDARLLETNGVLFRENDQYWIPEIFRHGLAFSATGRPRILAIANLVRRRNDLRG